MNLNIDVTDITTGILACMTENKIQDAMQDDEHLQDLSNYIINGWPSTRPEVKHKIDQ